VVHQAVVMPLCCSLCVDQVKLIAMLFICDKIKVFISGWTPAPLAQDEAGVENGWIDVLKGLRLQAALCMVTVNQLYTCKRKFLVCYFGG